MRALVTGAQGWVGRYVSDALLADPTATVMGLGRSKAHTHFTHELLGLGAAPLPDGIAQTLASPRYTYRACDLLDAGDLADVMRTFAPTVVFHLAGATPGHTPAQLKRLNVDATDSVTSAVASLASPVVLVHVSSGSIYGEPDYLPQDEDHPPGPVTGYAQTKLAAEQAVRKAQMGTDTSLIIARVFNVVGPGCPQSLLPGTLALQLAAAANDRGPGKITMGPLDSVRDYIDVRDCARALVHLATRPGRSHITYNVASGQGTQAGAIWKRLRDIARASGAPPVTTAKRPPFPDNVSKQIADIQRLRDTGFVHLYDIEDSLSDLYDWACCALTVAVPNNGRAVSSREKASSHD